MDIEVKNEKKKPQLKDHELKALIQQSQDGRSTSERYNRSK